jgi:O-acetylserine/cysteine efflux transporter
MRFQHVIAAIVVAAIWGLSFVVVRLGLGYFPPLFLAALRFCVAALAVFFVPRPDISWSRMFVIAMALFVGEFGFLFVGMAQGMPPGLASIAIQSQAFFTLLMVAIVSGTTPTLRQAAGTIIGLGGLAVISSTIGGDVSSIGLVLTIAAALSWATGNVLLKSTGKVDMLALVAWLSVIPPVPLLILSLVFEGAPAITGAITGINAAGIAAVLYLAIPATLIAFWIWGKLLKIYSPQIVAPFSLLVPIFGIVSAALVFNEQIGSTRFIGMGLVIAGLAVVMLPLAEWFRRKTPVASPH